LNAGRVAVHGTRSVFVLLPCFNVGVLRFRSEGARAAFAAGFYDGGGKVFKRKIVSVFLTAALILPIAPFGPGAVFAESGAEPPSGDAIEAADEAPAFAREEFPEATILSEEEAEAAGLALIEPEINPDYIRWQNGGDFGGLIPEKYVYEREPNNTLPRGLRFASASEAQYDPRKEAAAESALTPAKDQGSLDTCWAFSAIGALEAFVEKRDDGDTDPDFSEQHLRYATSKDTEGNLYAFERPNNGYGGNANMAMAYFTRNPMSGPVSESQDAYNALTDVRSASEIGSISRAGIVTGTAELPNLSEGSPGDEGSGSYINQIKTLISEYGAATVSYRSGQTTSVGGGGEYHRIGAAEYATCEDQYSYHYSGSDSTNHAVLIIGWDDNFPATAFGTAPSGPGAWLIKNSWNTEYSLDDSYESYFWMSYYTPIKGVCAITGYNDNFTDVIYDYTPKYQPSLSGSVSIDTVYDVNIFDCTEAGAVLNQVQVYNVNGASSYEIYAVAGETSYLSDKRILALVVEESNKVATGTFQHDGYHTIDIPDVNLGAGKTFAIVLKTTVGGEAQARTTYGSRDYAGDSGNVGYYSQDGNTWSGYSSNGACAIRAIVTGGDGWTCQERLVDTIEPTVALTAPSGTIEADALNSGSLTLTFSEWVEPVVGKWVTVLVNRKEFTYNEVSQASPKSVGGTHHRYSYVITGDLTVQEAAGIYTATIPFASFFEDDYDVPNTITNDPLSGLYGYANTDMWRAYSVLVEPGTFIDALGNGNNIGVMGGHADNPQRIQIDGVFYSKMKKVPTIGFTKESDDSLTPLISPQNGAENVETSGNIAITFNRQMDKLTSGSVVLTPGNISLTNGTWSGGEVSDYPQRLDLNPKITYEDGVTYTVPYSGLTADTTYTLNISDFKDPDGNTMTASTSYTFKTAPDTTAPVLSAGSAVRTSDTEATVGFTSSEAGTAYFTAVTDGGAAPDKESVASSGTNLGTVTAGSNGDLSVTLTAGAKDVYVTVKDAAGNIGEVLKIDVEAYAAPDAVINIAAISGVTPPAYGATPVTAITETDQYTGTVAWSGNPATFAANTAYTATITLTAKTGYTLTGVTEDFFTVANATSVSNDENGGVITAVFPATESAPDTVINIAAISGVTPPAYGATPVTAITETAQYTGTVSWSGSPGTFAANTQYTATITLTAKTGYTLTGVTEDFFTVTGATSVSNDENGGVITAVFPQTGSAPDAAIDIAAIGGVTPPAYGATPVTAITETAQYTGTVSWSGNPATFAANTAYTATITLTAKTGYTLTGVTEDFFTVTGATSVSNDENGGVITAVFPQTGGTPQTPSVVAHTVTFNGNGGTPATQTKIVTAPAISVGSLPGNPTRSGYAFKEWNTNSGGSGTVFTAATAVSADITVYAQWTANNTGSNTPGAGNGNSGSGGASSAPANTTPNTEETKNVTTEINGKTISTPAGKEPVNNGDGTVTLPDGGTVTQDNGVLVEAPSGTVVDADRNLTIPKNGTGVVKTPGNVEIEVEGGAVIGDDGTILLPIGSGAIADFPGGDTIEVPGGYIIEIANPDTPLSSALHIYWNNPFSDVGNSAWYYGDVEYAHTRGLFSGTSDSTFDPSATMTRGMIVTVLGRLRGVDTSSYGISSFGDVENGQYYTAYIEWAKESGIVTGIGNGKFAPDAKISRQDLAVIILRYSEFAGIQLSVTSQSAAFADETQITDYAKNAVNALSGGGIINGKSDNFFDPKGSATRAEAAAMLHRFIEKTSN
jgi:uncharacterized repeat protein (TIGR02543 family)